MVPSSFSAVTLQNIVVLFKRAKSVKTRKCQYYVGSFTPRKSIPNVYNVGLLNGSEFKIKNIYFVGKQE